MDELLYDLEIIVEKIRHAIEGDEHNKDDLIDYSEDMKYYANELISLIHQVELNHHDIEQEDRK